MSVYLGSTEIAAAYIGSSAVTKIYVGDTQAWALTQDLDKTYTNAVGITDSHTAILAGEQAHYSDDFNRGDTSSLGANWTNRVSSGNQFYIVSNRAEPHTADQSAISSYASVMNTDNVRVTATIGTPSATWDYVMLYLRSNNSQQVWAWIYGGGTWKIHTNSGAYTLSGSQRAVTGGSLSLSNGDVLTFEAAPSGSDQVYTLKQNSTTRLTWTDTNGATYPYVDSSHREVAVGANWPSGATRTNIDSFAADDI